MKKAGSTEIRHTIKKTNQGHSNNSKYKRQRAGKQYRGQGK